MHNGYGKNPTRAYLAQRIDTASPEELAAMLLEGAERFLLQAAAAIRRNEIMEKARLVDRVSQIMQKLLGMLNPDADRQLVDKLHGIYIWWIKEMFEGSRFNQPEQLEQVVRQMEAMREAWAQLATRPQRMPVPVQAQFSLEGLVG